MLIDFYVQFVMWSSFNYMDLCFVNPYNLVLVVRLKHHGLFASAQ